MVARMSVAMLLVSLLGCGKAGEKDPRMEKILKDREAAKASNGNDADFGKLPGTTTPATTKDSTTTPGTQSGDSTPGTQTGDKPPATPGTTTTGGVTSLGNIAHIGFFCSKASSSQIGTNLQKATGVSVKLLNVTGMIVAEDGDISRAQSRRTSVLSTKSIDVVFTTSVPDGLYYVAYCDAAQHAACNIPPDRRADPMDADNGKYSTGIVGYADNVSVSNGKIIAVGKTEALLPYPQTNDEKAVCDKLD